MKGVLICGGSGSRLKPLTEITNKSLLPVYDKPLILYPLQVMLDAGIREIAVVSGNEHIDQMAGFLGSGSRFSCGLTYRVQDRPRGIAHALSLAENFVDGDNVCAILGDNIFFDDLRMIIGSFKTGAHLFLKEVPDPERFGVATIEQTRNEQRETRNEEPVRPIRYTQGKQAQGRRGTRNIVIASIEEKPAKPASNLAVTGCYLYDKRCFDVIRTMVPSKRGELEITDVSRWYIEHGEIHATLLQQEWIDAGTFESLFRAAELVREKSGKMKDESGKEDKLRALPVAGGLNRRLPDKRNIEIPRQEHT